MDARTYLAEAAELAQELDKVLSDGRISLGEAFSLLGERKKVRELVASFGDAFADWKALKPLERRALADWFREEFDLANDQTEEVIEEIFEIIIKIGGLVTVLRKKRNEK